MLRQPILDTVLAVTCDNASNNTVIINKLSILVDTFAGTANHTHCFLHVVNLVAKSLIQQFEVKKEVAQDNELKEL